TLNADVAVSKVFGILLVFIACLLAFVGDIFESFLKRQAGIKDSGHILPGHGGFLDRFDAVIMVTFFFFVFRQELSRVLCI
ncbi:MAG: phosphatidate cytidylyltransferase, partial [Candidatus Dependentiae bacterium]|nr:phosphatidate cytidylyltransferase [Candidatus Dependentiae bacterium]